MSVHWRLHHVPWPLQCPLPIRLEHPHSREFPSQDQPLEYRSRAAVNRDTRTSQAPHQFPLQPLPPVKDYAQDVSGRQGRHQLVPSAAQSHAGRRM